MYTAIHHTYSERKLVADDLTLDEIIKKAKDYLRNLAQDRNEADLVVTIWQSCAVVAVVLDDANGLAAYRLRPYEERR